MKTTTLNQLNKLPSFTKNSLRVITQEPSNTLDISIKRMLAKNKLVKLKNGFYTTGSYFEKNGHKSEYKEFIANTLCNPSYLSLEYVLAKFDILTEGVRLFTSVSLKTTRNFENNLGSFTYQKIKEDLFTGYIEKDFGDNTYFIASKAKALFDYLYFFATTNLNKNYNLVEEKRLKLDIFTKNDWREFKRYLKLIGQPKANFIKHQLKSYAPKTSLIA
jgi:hypothetical protein